ncbi:MAG: iron-sulfur cluster assembly accessory protein, partial [Anaerolineales bacterium]|nr:iron-sulfur cluster assembly accessory protein [Anaerolineales bacterium]
KGMRGHALRIYVAGSSCCGIQFGMALDDKISATDTAFDTGAFKIVVDEQSLEYARGASIEFVNDPEKGQGFVINPPASTERDSCCGGGGGGSCSCNN